MPVLNAISKLDEQHVALRLHWHCHCFTKLGYSARVVPDVNHHVELQAFDVAQRAAFGEYGLDTIRRTMVESS